MSSKKIAKIGSALIIIAAILMAVSVVFGISIPGENTNGSQHLGTTTEGIIGIVKYICYAAAVILLVVLGVRFMTASPEGKAEIKKSAVIYVVGAALVFAAGAILGIIQNTMKDVVKE